ncbi:MAG: hypothetical protein ABIS18_01095 [Actinomycetota bacterium]
MSDTRRAPRLRRRLIVTLAMVGALSSVAVAATSYVLVARARTSGAIAQATRDGRFLLQIASDALPASDEDIQELLAIISRRGGSETVAELGGRVHQTSVTIGSPAIPQGLRRVISRGRVGVQTTQVETDPFVVVGGRIQPSSASFYFFFSNDRRRNRSSDT